MNVRSYLIQNRESVRNKLENGSLENKTKYLEEYVQWIARFKHGHPLSQIAFVSEASEQTVSEVLYAMDLRDMKYSDHLEEWCDLYYSDGDVTYQDVADYHNEQTGQDVHSRSVARVVRGPAHRILVEEQMGIEVDTVDPDRISDDEMKRAEQKARMRELKKRQKAKRNRLNKKYQKKYKGRNIKVRVKKKN